MRRTLQVLGLAVIFTFLLGAGLEACDPEPGPQHFPPPEMLLLQSGYFQIFNTFNGLPTNHVRSILALDNAIFVGTEGSGLLIYKNGAWEVYSPTSTPPFPSPTVPSLVLGPDKKSVYAGTLQGVVKITDFLGIPSFEPIPLSGAPGTNYLSLRFEGNHFYAGLDNSAGEIMGSAFQPFTYERNKFPSGFGCIQGRATELWFGTSAGLFKLQGASLEPVEFPDTDFGWVGGLGLLNDSLLVGGSKGLFLITPATCSEILPGVWVTRLDLRQDIGASLADLFFQDARLEGPSTARQKSYEEKVGSLKQRSRDLWVQYQNILNKDVAAQEGYIQKVIELQDDLKVFAGDFPLLKGLWVGTQDQGLIFYCIDGQRRMLNTENSRLPSNRITCISAREDGETWIGTFDGGLARYRKYFSGAPTVPEDIWWGKATALELIGETLYIGTEKDGLLTFDIKSKAQTGAFNSNNTPMFHQKVTDIAGDKDGDIWVTGDHGLWRLGPTYRKQFLKKDGLPDEITERVEIDKAEHIFVSGGPGPKISGQVSVFDGAKFVNYDVDNLRKLLASNPASAAEALKALGLMDTFQQAFDLQNASMALLRYDDGKPAGKITALLGLPQYLIMGTDVGEQYIFDGQSFKRLSPKGTGNLGPIVKLGRRSNGTLVIVGQKGVQTFDGKDYQPLIPIASPTAKVITDMVMDDRNADLFWASFEGTGSSGVALYQELDWRVVNTQDRVNLIGVSEPYVFFATNEAVFRMSVP